MIPPSPPATTCFSGKKRSQITQENKEGGRQDKEQEMSLRRKPGATYYKYPFILVFPIRSLLARVRRTRQIYIMFIMKQNEEHNIYIPNFWLKEIPLSSRKNSEFRVWSWGLRQGITVETTQTFMELLRDNRQWSGPFTTTSCSSSLLWFFFCLHWVFVAACGLSPDEGHGLSCSVACRILVPGARIRLTSHALEDGFLTTGLPGKPCISLSVRSVTKPSLYVQWGQTNWNVSLEQKKICNMSMPGDRWLMPLEPRTFQRVSAKHFRRQGEGRAWFIDVQILCCCSCPCRSVQGVSVNFQKRNIFLHSVTFYLYVTGKMSSS